MTLTVRPRGKLLPDDSDGAAIEVTAVIWSEKDPSEAAWGGIIEATGAAELRRRVGAGLTRYRLRLADGREGTIDLRLSEFEADGERPFVFDGIGKLGLSSGTGQD